MKFNQIITSFTIQQFEEEEEFVSESEISSSNNMKFLFVSEFNPE